MSGAVTPTVVLGFDALDFEYLDAFAGALPNFERLRAEGVEAPLRSTFPPWTGSAWPSMYTGVGPDHHGVYDFMAHGEGYPDEAEVVARPDVAAPALWNYLTARDVPSVVLNVPATHPAEPVEGVLIPGYLAPEDAPGHPEGVREELSDAIGEPYRIYSRAEMADDGDRKLDGYLELIRTRGAAARELLAAREWGLALIQVQKTDAVFHNFDDEASFRAVYEAADDLVGTVLEAVDDANVVVCSDHGIGRVDGYRIYLNEVLREAGYVEAAAAGDHATLASRKADLVGAAEGRDRAGGEGSGDGTARAGGDGETTGPSAGGATETGSDGATGSSGGRNGTGDGRADGASVAGRALSGMLSAAEAAGISRGDLYAVARRLGVDEPLRAALPESVTGTVAEAVDWRRSTAYCRSGSELGVRINLAGREPAGVVPPDEYERVRTELVALLSDLETPDGSPAFEAVRRREAVYDGPMTDAACDVLVTPAGMNNTVATSLMGRRFLPVDRYDHKRRGVFLAAGPDVAPSADPGELALTDVAPIAMAAAGLDVPERMRGSVPDGLLTSAPRRSRYEDVAYGTTERADVGSEGDDAVTDRLEDLGYLG